MLERLLKNHVRGCAGMAGMLASYGGRPAFFHQRAPQDKDRGWDGPCYPRADFNIDMRHDPERKAVGSLEINIYCTTESADMPEDIERRLVALANGTFYRGGDGAPVCAAWSRSDAFALDGSRAGTATAPEIIGVTVLFDLMEFPPQITTDPDPVQGLDAWTRGNFQDAALIAQDMPPVFKPTDGRPAVYWRFEGAQSDDRQSYAVSWHDAQLAAHVIAGTVAGRNGWIKAMAERMRRDGEVIMPDGSPMFVQQVTVRHGADPLRDGQLLVSGRYGVLERHRKEAAQAPLNRAVATNLGNMEVTANG